MFLNNTPLTESDILGNIIMRQTFDNFLPRSWRTSSKALNFLIMSQFNKIVRNNQIPHNNWSLAFNPRLLPFKFNYEVVRFQLVHKRVLDLFL